MKILFHFILVLFIIAITVSCTELLKDNTRHYQYTHKSAFIGSPIKIINIWIDKDFGQADQISIDDAISQWNYSLNGLIKLNVVDTNFNMEISKIQDQQKLDGWIFLKIDHNNKLIPGNKENNVVLGFCNHIDGNYMFIVRDRIRNEDVFGVSLHEIGHLLGAHHTDENLMSPGYSFEGFKCIDLKAIKEVAEYQNLPINSLNYCVYNE